MQVSGLFNPSNNSNNQFPRYETTSAPHRAPIDTSHSRGSRVAQEPTKRQEVNLFKLHKTLALDVSEDGKYISLSECHREITKSLEDLIEKNASSSTHAHQQRAGQTVFRAANELTAKLAKLGNFDAVSIAFQPINIAAPQHTSTLTQYDQSALAIQEETVKKAFYGLTSNVINDRLLVTSAFTARMFQVSVAGHDAHFTESLQGRIKPENQPGLNQTQIVKELEKTQSDTVPLLPKVIHCSRDLETQKNHENAPDIANVSNEDAIHGDRRWLKRKRTFSPTVKRDKSGSQLLDCKSGYSGITSQDRKVEMEAAREGKAGVGISSAEAAQPEALPSFEDDRFLGLKPDQIIKHEETSLSHNGSCPQRINETAEDVRRGRQDLEKDGIQPNVDPIVNKEILDIPAAQTQKDSVNDGAKDAKLESSSKNEVEESRECQNRSAEGAKEEPKTDNRTHWQKCYDSQKEAVVQAIKEDRIQDAVPELDRLTKLQILVKQDNKPKKGKGSGIKSKHY